MNYKKLKRVFALGMAVLLSVSTSVYGGTMEVMQQKQLVMTY